jgi:selT/selW/selH-like putative selenoprotein
LAAELKEHFGEESELVASGGGVFEVTCDETIVFSKQSLSRFPEEGEVVRTIRALGD